MPWANVLDYSGFRPSAPALVQAGVVGVCRYLYLGTGTTWKALTKPEDVALRTAGIAVAGNAELARDTWLKGYPEGLRIGEIARQQMRGLGRPDERPIIFSVDTGVAPSQRNLAMDFMRGCNDGGGCGPQALYHGTNLINMAHDLGLIRFGWRAMSSSWSTVPSNHVAIHQQVTQSYPQWNTDPRSYDENIIIQPDWGQFPAPGGADMAVAPYSLWTDQTGALWRIDAGQQSKVWIPDVPQRDWNQAVLRIGGFADTIGSVGSNATLIKWLADIPRADQVNAATAEATAAKQAGQAAQAAAVTTGDAVTALATATIDGFTTQTVAIHEVLLAVQSLSTGGINVEVLVLALQNTLPVPIAKELGRRLNA